MITPGIGGGEKELSVRERNKRRTQQMLEEALASTAVASGTASPEQQSTAQGMAQGPPPLAPLAPLQLNRLNQGSRTPDSILGNLKTNGPPTSSRSINSDTSSIGMESIAHVAHQAGFRGEDLAKAVAVAMAESRGNPNARGDVDLQEPGEQSTGLWQIHYRPSRDGGVEARDPGRNTDPVTNAKNARQIWEQQGWNAWSVTHGTPDSNANHYSRYLDDARRAAAQFGQG